MDAKDSTNHDQPAHKRFYHAPSEQDSLSNRIIIILLRRLLKKNGRKRKQPKMRRQLIKLDLPQNKTKIKITQNNSRLNYAWKTQAGMLLIMYQGWPFILKITYLGFFWGTSICEGCGLVREVSDINIADILLEYFVCTERSRAIKIIWNVFLGAARKTY